MTDLALLRTTNIDKRKIVHVPATKKTRFTAQIPRIGDSKSQKNFRCKLGKI
jgi:hypothetical protein